VSGTAGENQPTNRALPPSGGLDSRSETDAVPLRDRRFEALRSAGAVEAPRTNGSTAWRLARFKDVPASHRPYIRRGWLVRRALLAADLVGLLAAFFITELLFIGLRSGSGIGIGTRSLIFVLLLPVWVVAAKLYGLYDRDEERATHSTADEVMTVFHLITVGVFFFYATSWVVGLWEPHQKKLASFWLLAILAVTGMRGLARVVVRRHPAYAQNTVVVGAGDVGQLVARKLVHHPEYRINFLGFVDAAPKELRSDLADAAVLGGPGDLAEIVERENVDRVIIAFSQEPHERTVELVRALRNKAVQIDIVPRLFEAVSPTAPVHGIEALPLLSAAPAQISRSSRLLKRSFDVALTSILLAVAAPIMLVIAWLVRRDSPGPVLYRQPRLGLEMREFTLLKFRTMQVGTDSEPHRQYLKQIMSPSALPGGNRLYKLDRADAVTRVGRWLRRTSLDELPQLLNVLRGDMSLVGPRPAIPYELELYTPHHFERFLVPAGLTGLWQVEARAHSTFGEALELDVVYARSWSFGLDLRLLLRTPIVMLRRGETG
jgi:exopolysaccharide biosynthesis polyprenyl glycosylphosphotransferase